MQMPISSRSSCPSTAVPWTPEPTRTRRIVPRSASSRNFARPVRRSDAVHATKCRRPVARIERIGPCSGSGRSCRGPAPGTLRPAESRENLPIAPFKGADGSTDNPWTSGRTLLRDPSAPAPTSLRSGAQHSGGSGLWIREPCQQLGAPMSENNSRDEVLEALLADQATPPTGDPAPDPGDGRDPDRAHGPPGVALDHRWRIRLPARARRCSGCSRPRTTSSRSTGTGWSRSWSLSGRGALPHLGAPATARSTDPQHERLPLALIASTQLVGNAVATAAPFGGAAGTAAQVRALAQARRRSAPRHCGHHHLLAAADRVDRRARARRAGDGAARRRGARDARTHRAARVRRARAHHRAARRHVAHRLGGQLDRQRGRGRSCGATRSGSS